MAVRIEKIIITVLHKAHRLQQRKRWRVGLRRIPRWFEGLFYPRSKRLLGGLLSESRSSYHYDLYDCDYCKDQDKASHD